MSVMQRLQELSSEEGTSSMPKFTKEGGMSSEKANEVEQMMMAQPIPGQSLTQDPENRLPYEQPPKFTDIQEFIDETFLRFTDEERLPDLLDAMRYGLPVEHLAEKYLMMAMTKGDITPDLVLLTIEPVIYMLISLATFAQIDPVLYPEDPMMDEEETTTHTDLYRKATKELLRTPENPTGEDKKLTVDDLQAPTNVPTSLLARSKEAVGAMTKGDV